MHWKVSGNFTVSKVPSLKLKVSSVLMSWTWEVWLCGFCWNAAIGSLWNSLKIHHHCSWIQGWLQVGFMVLESSAAFDSWEDCSLSKTTWKVWIRTN
jgi:hypothetical protein